MYHGEKPQILFSCSFLFHLMHLKAAGVGKCFIRLLGCSHQPQRGRESLVPAKPERKEGPFQSFYNSHATVHPQRPQENDRMTKPVGCSDKQSLPHPSLGTNLPHWPPTGHPPGRSRCWPCPLQTKSLLWVCASCWEGAAPRPAWDAPKRGPPQAKRALPLRSAGQCCLKLSRARLRCHPGVLSMATGFMGHQGDPPFPPLALPTQAFCFSS